MGAPSHQPGLHVQVRPFVVAQQHIEDPLLIDGLKFGIRVWCVVTSTEPLRAYMHSGGLVLFSGDSYDGDSIAGVDGSIAGVRMLSCVASAFTLQTIRCNPC